MLANGSGGSAAVCPMPERTSAWRAGAYELRKGHRQHVTFFAGFPFMAQRLGVTEPLENVAGGDAATDGSCIFQYAAVSNLESAACGGGKAARHLLDVNARTTRRSSATPGTLLTAFTAEWR